MGLSEIISIVAFCLTAIVNGALFFHQKRSFDSIDKRLDDGDKRCTDMDTLIRKLQIEEVRAEALCKAVDETKARLGSLIELRSEFLERLGDYIRRGDFVRDTQILTNQIEAIHKKIDYVDTKFDRFREATHGK